MQYRISLAALILCWNRPLIRRGKSADSYYPTNSPLTIKVRDTQVVEGDAISITVVTQQGQVTPAYTMTNGQLVPVPGPIVLTASDVTYYLLGFGPGVSNIIVTPTSVGTAEPVATFSLKIEPSQVTYGYADYSAELFLDQPFPISAKFLQVVILRSQYQAAADHIAAAQTAANPPYTSSPAPRVLTFRAHTVESTGIRTRSTRRFVGTRLSTDDRDEYPFASTFENNGSNASIRAINLSVNRGAGTAYRLQIERWNIQRGDNFEVVIQ